MFNLKKCYFHYTIKFIPFCEESKILQKKEIMQLQIALN